MLWVVYVFAGMIGLVILLVLVLALLGRRLPETHTASVSLRFTKTPPDRVWTVIADAAAYPSWASGVTKVEKLPDHNGHETFRQTMGRNSFVLETTRSETPRLLERTIGDDHGHFSGSWTYELTPDGPGCTVKITERGRIKSAVPRAMMKYLVGYHLYLGKHLKALAVKFGEAGEIARTVG